MPEPPRLRVDPSGGGDAVSLGRALALLPEPPLSGGASISLEAGTYREKNLVSYPGLRLRGAGMDKTSLVWGDYARMPGPDGRPIRTFATATLLVEAAGVRLEGLSIVNDAGRGEDVGQAIALYADADLLCTEECRISGRQDSLFLGPLPPTPIEGADFGGPRDGLPRLVGRQLYRSCLVEGDVDFVFGSAQAAFLDCRLRSLARSGDPTPCGYLAAPSTPENSPVGFLFIRCALEAEAGLPPNSVFLARPWREWAQAIFHRCAFGDHIKDELWDDWGKSAAREKSFFAHAECYRLSTGDKGRVPVFAGRPWEKTIGREKIIGLYGLFAQAFPGLDPYA